MADIFFLSFLRGKRFALLIKETTNKQKVLVCVPALTYD